MIAKQGVLLSKYGQEVIRITSGKRIHGTGTIPGGVNKSLSIEERDYLSKDIGSPISEAASANLGQALAHLFRFLKTTRAADALGVVESRESAGEKEYHVVLPAKP